MAENESQRAAGGFSLSKRYGPLPAWAWGLLGGAGVYAVWRFRQSRQAASGSTAATASTADAQQVDYAPQISVLQAEVQQLQQGESGEGISKPPAEDHDKDDDTGKHGRPGKPERMPDVVGERANFAIGELKSGYGVLATTVPPRSPRQEYIVTGQAPKAGARVRPGSRAVLRVKVDHARRPGHRSKRRTVPDIPGGPMRRPG